MRSLRLEMRMMRLEMRSGRVILIWLFTLWMTSCDALLSKQGHHHSVIASASLRSHTTSSSTSASTTCSSSSSSSCQEFYEKHLLRIDSKEEEDFSYRMLRISNNHFVGLHCSAFFHLWSDFHVNNQSTLEDLVFHRPAGQGLLTVSNHQSILDDPGLWAAMLPWYRLRPEALRWVLCTENIYFARPWLSAILEAGNVLPIDRAGLIDQPLLHLFSQKLANEGAWCHIFPEGRVWQNWRFEENEAILGPLRWGVGKIIAHSYSNIPIVLPLYHRGMSSVVPEIECQERKKHPQSALPQSLLPRRGQEIEVFIGEPLDFRERIATFLAAHPGELSQWRTTRNSLQLYGEIAWEVQKALQRLEAQAYKRQSCLPVYDPKGRWKRMN